MPNVTATPKGLLNGEVVTEFTDTTSTVSVTYTYQLQQAGLMIENSGLADIFVTVGSYTNKLIKPDTKWKVKIPFTSFSIRSNANSQEFVATAFQNDIEGSGEADSVARKNMADIAYGVVHAVSYIDLNGTGDDSIGAQQAINAGTGRTIIFPSKPNGYIFYHSLEIPDNTKVIFPGESGKILIPVGSDLNNYPDLYQTWHGKGFEAIITNKNHVNGKNVHIIGAYIDGQNNLDVTQPMAGIMLKNCENSSVTKCLIKGLPNGPTVPNANRERYMDIMLYGGKNNYIAHNRCYPVAYECIGIRYGACENTIFDNYCEQAVNAPGRSGWGGHCIQATSAWEEPETYMVRGNIISYNKCYYPGYAGIICHNAKENIVSNNFVYYAAAEGLSVTGPYSDGCIVTDNQIYNSTGYDVVPKGGRGIKLYNANKCVVKGNTIRNVAGNGITVSPASTENIIQGNVINTATDKGIFIDTDSQYNMVSDNLIKSCGLNGIECSNSASYNDISNNTIKNCGENGIEILGASAYTSIKNNKILDSGKNGINVVADCNVTIIQGNLVRGSGTLTNVTYSQIVLASLQNSVQNNVVKQGGNANTPQYGIWVKTGANNNFVTNNDLFGAASGVGLLDNGTSTITAAGNRTN